MLGGSDTVKEFLVLGDAERGKDDHGLIEVNGEGK